MEIEYVGLGKKPLNKKFRVQNLPGFAGSYYIFETMHFRAMLMEIENVRGHVRCWEVILVGPEKSGKCP